MMQFVIGVVVGAVLATLLFFGIMRECEIYFDKKLKDMNEGLTNTDSERC